jgi:broad specificity phosphatase PhoE
MSIATDPYDPSVGEDADTSPASLGRRALLTMPLLAGVPLGAAAQTPKPDYATLTAELRRGGHVIVVRHGATHANQADLAPLNPEGPAAQRQLNDKGRDAAKSFGAALKAIGVPVGKTYTSRFNRAFETALLAGLGEAEKSTDFTETGMVVSPNENARRVAALRKLAETPPATGTTVIVVTHKPNIMEAFGKDWFEVREGEATIFKPKEEGGTVVVTRVLIEQWPAIAAAVPR